MIPVWGKDKPGQAILLRFRGDIYEGVTSTSGDWKIAISPQNEGGPYEMYIQGSSIKRIKGVMIGDVWLAAGQSNMEYKFYQYGEDYPDRKFTSGTDRISFFEVTNNHSQTAATSLGTGTWRHANNESIKYMSVVAYSFAENLHRVLNVPIGIISADTGNTRIESWISKNAMSSHFINRTGLPQKKSGNLMEFDTSSLFNAMISPLTDWPVKGIIWYQGESNTGNPEEYGRLFSLLINDWRVRWKQERLPFLFVQLPNYGKDDLHQKKSNLAILRDAQFKSLRLKNTGCATAIDLGGNGDNLHPERKAEIGRRLALQALKIAYGRDVESGGPEMKNVEKTLSVLKVTFHQTGLGLASSDKSLKIRGFFLKGDTGKFIEAEATISDHSLYIHSDKISNPKTLAYAWSANPQYLNLVNSAGLPAYPFITSNFLDKNPCELVQ